MQRPEEGYGTLLKIHGSELAKKEARQIQDSIDQNLEKPKVNFFSKVYLRHYMHRDCIFYVATIYWD